ncbi:MAG: DUF2971 domain-containing protein [Caldisericia bacterium]|nr:DUF2971 domain-containing protein [Caldisericia bacterium]
MEKFFKIIESKTLRLTDLAHTNDSLEVKYGLDQLYKYYFELTKKEPSEELKKMMWLNNRGAYATCFSENGDMLSQWRGYADDGKGFSIGFDFDALDIDRKYPWNSCSKKDAFAYEKIIYNYDDVRNILNNNDILKQRCADTDKIPTLGNIYSIIVNAESNPKEFDNIYCGLGDITFFIKNPAFEEEKEWRIVYRDIFYNTIDIQRKYENIQEFDHLGQKHFYMKNDIVSSYFEWNFMELMPNNPIKNIVFGPNCKCSADDIKLLLYNNGFEVINTICFLRSNASYRI